jgi:hypothetical protein
MPVQNALSRTPCPRFRLGPNGPTLRLGSEIVASTLPQLKEREFARQLRPDARLQEQVNIDGERFFARSVDLTSGVQPVSIIVLA